MENIPQKCNNPVNLMLSKPVGECTDIYRPDKKSELGYCVFPTPLAGWRAAHRQIAKDQGRGLTFRQFIEKFAPPNENNTSAYLVFVTQELKVHPNDLLSSVSKYAIAGVMAQMEGYYNAEGV